MSANPQMMAQMLAAQLGGQGQGATGVQAPMGGAAQLAQKIMLMQALQKGQQPGMQPPQQMPQMPPQQPMPPMMPGAPNG